MFNVSRETLKKLSNFEDLVKSFNKKTNIISKNTLDNIWQRHFADSAKLYSIMEQVVQKKMAGNLKICDAGAGAGFPSLILAMMNDDKGLDVSFTLVESNKKKCAFLEDSIQKLGVKLEVINERVENLNKDFDLIFARAVAPLPKLLNNCNKISKKDTVYIFPKGKSFEVELFQLKKKWHYNVNIVKNNIAIDKSGGVTLVLSDVRKVI